jgi:hypothetical protein
MCGADILAKLFCLKSFGLQLISWFLITIESGEGYILAEREDRIDGLFCRKQLL